PRCRTARPAGCGYSLADLLTGVGRAGRGDLGGPAVVGLAGGVALDGGLDPQGARAFVAGDLAAGVLIDLVDRWDAAVPGVQDGGDLLPHPLVGHAQHERVVDVGVRFEGGLDLLGVHLLAAGVDGHRAAAEHGDGAVGLDAGVVAGNGVALAVIGAEGLGGLGLVLVVAERDVAGARDLADDRRSGFDLVAVVVEHRGLAVDHHARPPGVVCALPGGGQAGEPGLG